MVGAERLNLLPEMGTKQFLPFGVILRGDLKRILTAKGSPLVKLSRVPRGTQNLEHNCG